MKFERCICHMLLLLCGCLASIVHTPAHSQDVLALEDFSERLSKDVPVSGRMLVGAVVLSDATAKAPPSLLTPMLLWRSTTAESAKEPLCVTFASRDGQYYGEGKLSAATLAGLRKSVRVQGDYKQAARTFVSGLPAYELAVLASIGDCRLGVAGKKTITIHVLDGRDAGAPARQGTAPSEFILFLMLNSMTYTLTVEASIPGIVGLRQADCRALDDVQRNKSFDTLCKLAVPNTATKAELVIKRRRYERGFDPIRFNLSWSPL
jgi:hypothetical protein